ncbi:MAG: metalloregulator ArsR/SmtB family transcription factor [Oscillospiraceae bacterium]|nr:metalloregulator ArsR/SmtB family transcription factor [Oscillospiraceae bacterium]
MNTRKTALIFKALGDENRIRILQLLQNGEICACKLLEELNITQPTLSHHMKILCDSEIVSSRKEGKWMHYSISADGAEFAISCLRELTNTK